VNAALRARPAGGGPVFATIEGGMSRLVDALAGGLRPPGSAVRLGATARELVATLTGWRLVVGPTSAPETVEADAVVLAVPARPAARLLSTVDRSAAAMLGTLDYASVALVSLALPAVELPALSGFLVPATEGYSVKAATFFTRKWSHHDRPDGLVLVRASLGRYGDEHVLQRDDADLVTLVRHELSELLGQRLPAPVDAVVSRWGGALPQYPPGHLGRVTAVRAALPATLAIAGAALDGVGIAACVRSGQVAAETVLSDLAVFSHARATPS
jgi:oxygen-dependent protoporphyrinogen oxidase